MNQEITTTPSIPAWRDELSEYPDSSHFASIGGYQMHYIAEGTGQPVLMVDGNPTWSFYYRNLVTGLSNTHRSIAIDHIGCGLSEKPPNLTYTLNLRIEHLVEFVRQLDLTDINLVVHDWGGAIGLGAALADLKRYRSFTIFNTAAFPPPFFPLRIRVCQTPLLGKFALQGLNLFARAATRMATERKGGLPDKVSRGMLAPYDSWGNRRAIYEFVADIPTRQDDPTWIRLAEIESGLSRLSEYPVKLIWGMKDWCFRPECLRKFQNLLPHASICEFADGGHYVVEDEATNVLEQVRQFLAGSANDKIAG